ncbi:hypothetical protein [Yoonia algicola]|uniref:Uncharacterized protein n=1 Tax=Yoonia algicola TaxID=3137368 RepID=A0AAN0NG30_9RHOB
MKRGHTSFIVFLVILFAPVIALNVGGFNIGKVLSERATATSSASLMPNLMRDQATPDQSAWLNARPELRGIFNPDERTPARVITIEEIVSTEDLFLDGEAIPQNSLIALYAAARAPARLSGYCTEVIATVGLSCDVIHAETHQNGKGDWVMTGQLAFVPAADLGDPAVVTNGQIFSTTALLPYPGDLRPENATASRAGMLTQAQDVCDTLRKQFGNCVLTNVTFEVSELWITDLEVLPAGTNPMRVEATAEFTVYADEMTTDQNSFAEQVAAVVNPG